MNVSKCGIEPLEQPNIVFGVGAGGWYLHIVYMKRMYQIQRILYKNQWNWHYLLVSVLSYAELIDKPAKLYILYIDSFVLDSKCAEPILQVLTDEIPCKLQPKFKEKPFSKGNLYMWNILIHSSFYRSISESIKYKSILFVLSYINSYVEKEKS